MLVLIVLCFLLASLQTVSGFSMGTPRRRQAVLPRQHCIVCSNAKSSSGKDLDGPLDGMNEMDRRSLLSAGSKLVPASALAFAVAALSAGAQTAAAAIDDEGGNDIKTDNKITVFGGSGYVGAHVLQLLTDQGYKVVSVSKSSPAQQAEKVSKVLGTPLPSSAVEYVSLDASKDDLTNVLQNAKVVVSCVGMAPGSKQQREGNGAVNIRIANAAKDQGVDRFVYISLASSLAKSTAAKLVLGDYVLGKSEAEAAVVKDFESDARLVVKPAIIAGGPPGEIRPPGPPGVKAVSVDSVAKVVVAGALGQASGSVDGNEAIDAFSP